MKQLWLVTCKDENSITDMYVIAENLQDCINKIGFQCGVITAAKMVACEDTRCFKCYPKLQC